MAVPRDSVSQHVPEHARYARLRAALAIDPITDDSIRFEVARGQRDLEAAYRLVHRTWTKERLIEPHPSGMAVTLFHALPQTSVLIARRGDAHGGEVIGAVTLVKDSRVGLPSDVSFHLENDALRASGARLIEITGLAVAPELRSADHRITFHLAKFAIEYAVRFMRGSRLVLTPHPRAADFYGAYFGMVQRGIPRVAANMNGTWALHLGMDVTSAGLLRLKGLYGGPDGRANLGQFVLHHRGPFNFPERELHDPQCVLHPVMTPGLLEYFFARRTDLFARLSGDELATVRTAYEPHFDLDWMECLRRGPAPELPVRPFRFPTELRVMVVSRSERPLLATVLDISVNGLFLSTNAAFAPGERVELQFYVNGRPFRLGATVQWANGGQNLRQPRGYGMKLLESESPVLRETLAMLHGPALRRATMATWAA